MLDVPLGKTPTYLSMFIFLFLNGFITPDDGNVLLLPSKTPIPPAREFKDVEDLLPKIFSYPH